LASIVEAWRWERRWPAEDGSHLLRGRRRKKDEPQAITKRESREAGEMEATRGGGIQIDQQCVDNLIDSSTSV